MIIVRVKGRCSQIYCKSIFVSIVFAFVFNLKIQFEIWYAPRCRDV